MNIPATKLAEALKGKVHRLLDCEGDYHITIIADATSAEMDTHSDAFSDIVLGDDEDNPEEYEYNGASFLRYLKSQGVDAEELTLECFTI